MRGRRDVIQQTPQHGTHDRVQRLSLLAGTDKRGAAECVGRLDMRRGTIVAVVGPTGSGKSELLTDIEQCACRDTVTARQLLVDGCAPDPGSCPLGLMARLSQSTSFLTDSTVEAFVRMHAQCRERDAGTTVEEVLDLANSLSGEPMDGAAPLHVLSGGQSRALMIADLAVVSDADVVLVDEVENAGIDKFQALGTLTRRGKLVVMSTHHPVLMLMSDVRVVMQNGGMATVIGTSDAERECLGELRGIDDRLSALRNRLRAGETLDASTRP